MLVASLTLRAALAAMQVSHIPDPNTANINIVCIVFPKKKVKTSGNQVLTPAVSINRRGFAIVWLPMIAMLPKLSGACKSRERKKREGRRKRFRILCILGVLGRGHRSLGKGKARIQSLPVGTQRDSDGKKPDGHVPGDLPRDRECKQAENSGKARWIPRLLGLLHL